MLWSKMFIPTLREAPADVDDAGTRLLIRAGYQRAGVHLALGQRSLTRLGLCVRAGFDGQEVSGDALVEAARGALRSYKQLPQVWFQQRNGSFEICSFELGDTKARELEAMFRRILQACGLPFIVADCRHGRELVALSPGGERKLAWCEEAGFAATLDVACTVPKAAGAVDPDGDLEPERFYTPGKKTIADLVEFTGLPATSQIKSLIQVCDGEPYLVLVRGDHQLERAKLAAAVGAVGESRPATVEEIRAWFGGANPGSLGPVGVTNMPIFADHCLAGRRNMICGANEDDYHLRHVTAGEDFVAQFHDLRRAEDGDLCPTFPATVEIRTAHRLGQVTAVPAGFTVTDETGKEVAPTVTAATLDLAAVLRLAAAVCQDADGLTLALALAPFDVVITPANYGDPTQREAALSLYKQCLDRGVAVLLDDRDERPGVKFKDADLVGIPVRVTLGKKLPQGLVEVVRRHPKSTVDVPFADVLGTL